MNLECYVRYIKRISYLLFVIVCITIFSYAIHTQVTFNADVASLLYDTELFLSGGTYVKNFFETNPPMIFLIYTPIIILQKLTTWNIESLACLYMVFIGFISLAFCYALMKKTLSEESQFFKMALMVALLFTFFIVPVSDFGQREHLLYMLGMPYLFAVVARAKNISISNMQAISIGLMAGLVFSLKPFFLIPIILIELYLMVVKKSIWSWVRAESLVMLIVMVLYLAYVVHYHPLYFNVLMPLISQFYFLSTEENWLTIFSRPKVIFCSVIAAYYLFFFNKSHLRELSQVLFLALIGLMLAFIIPRSAWSYHVFPAYGIALVLSVIYVCHMWSVEIQKNSLRKREVLFILLTSFAMPIFIFSKDVSSLIAVLQYKDRSDLSTRIKTTPYKSIYCFSTMTTGLCFPLVTNNKREFGGRFPLLWWLRGVRKMEDKYGANNLPMDLMRGKNFLIDAVADDLNRYQPDLIIIYSIDEKWFLPKGYDYPAYFSQRENFRVAWSHYQLLDNIGLFRLYRRIPQITT